jgi:putative tricarboxylic transport membrane protein
VDAFTNLIMGFQIALSPYNLIIATAGIILGTIIGVLPGLGGANGVALLLPVTFVMPPTSGIILLSCIYWGPVWGAITSILFNIPGEPWSVATTLTASMAKQGSAGRRSLPPSCRPSLVRPLPSSW